MTDITDFVAKLKAKAQEIADGGDADKLSGADAAHELLRVYAEISQKKRFKPGQLVTSVDYGPYRAPKPGEPAIVVDLLPPGLTEKSGSGGTDLANWGLPLDLRIGVFVDAKHFALFAVSSAFFTPYVAPTAS